MLNDLKTAPLFFTLLWFSIFLGTGTIFSGYHFMDDHQILTFSDSIGKIGLFETLKEVVAQDLQIRLRPFYYIHRILLVYLIRDNFIIWSIYRGFLAIGCSCLLHFGSRNLGLNVLESMIFVLLALLGYHANIWYWLGPAEALGMFLLSAAFYFISRFYVSNKIIFLVLFVVSYILSCLSKESFLLTIPGVIIFLLYHFHNHSAKNKFGIASIVLFAFLTASLVFILTKIGKNSIGYAGVSDELQLGNFLIDLTQSMAQEKTNWLIFIGLGIVLFFTKAWNKQNMLMIGVAVISYIALAIPQYLLYYKSGFTSRYLLPLYFIYAFFILMILKHLKVSNWRMQILYISAIILFITIRFFLNTIPPAKEFTMSGKLTNDFIQGITQNANTSDSILIVSSVEYSYENSHSLRTYLTIKENKQGVYFYLTDNSETLNGFHTGLYKAFGKKNGPFILNEPNLTHFKVIAVFEKSESAFHNNFGTMLDALFAKKIITNPMGSFIFFVKK